MTDIYDQYFKEDIIEKAPSQNTGNDFAPNNRQPTFNVYDDFFKQQETSINNQVKRSLQLVMEKDPDKTGKALRLQEELGLHKSLALDSDEAIKLMRARNERKRLDSLELAKFSPILHRQLTDPKFAALAYDNLEDLQGLEKLFDDFTSIPENIGQGWAKGRLQMRRGHIGVERWLGKTDEKTDFELAEIDARLKEMEADGTGPFEEAFAVFGQYSKSLPKAVAAGTAGAGVGAAAGSWTGPGSAFTAKAGFVWGFMGSLAYDSLAIEGGNTYLALTEEDFNPTHSRWIALGTGLTSAALELWGLGIVTAPIRKLLVKQTTKQVAKQLAKPSGRLALGNFIINYAKIGTLESLTEVGQELTQILGRELAVLLDDREDIKSQLTSWEGVGEVAHQLSTVFLRSLQAMSIVGLVGSGPTFISDIQKARNTKKNEVFFEELTKQSSTSKLKERSVTDFENLTQQIGDKKNVSHIYVDANVFNNAMRQEGLSIEDVEKVSPTIANQLKELEKSGTISGGDIVIPIGEYSSKLIGTDFDNKILKQHRRLDKEDSFSTAENTFFEANREKLEKEANEIRNREENRNKEFRASAVKVKRDFVNMLRATGMGKATSKFRPKDVQYAATFYRDYAITQANKLKILPHEFAERFPFKIVGPDQAQVLAQQNINDVNKEINNFKQQLKDLGTQPPLPPENARFDESGNPTAAYQNYLDWETKTDELNNQIEELESEREIFTQKAKPQEQGKPVPDSVSQVNKLENSFDFAKSKPFPTNRQFKLELQERVKQSAKEAGIDVNDGSIETEKYLVQSVIDDANFALIENSNAVGWYNEKVTKAKRILSKIHPELATDPVANFAFTWALANTSNMIKVDKNFELAEIAYRHYKETGKFPTDIGIGKASDAINNNFKLFNRLIREKEFVQLEEFMKTQHTVKEVKEYTKSGVSGENLSEIVYGAAVMGPKIGNGFFANLYGFFEQLTMDRWLIRSWGRLTGTLVLDQRKQANMKRDQLKPLLKALTPKQKKQLQDLIGVKIRMTNLDEVAVAIDNASTDKPNRKIMNEIATIKDQPELEQTIIDILGKPRKGSERIGIGHEIRKNGVSYAKFLDGQKEAPSGAPERRFIRKVFNQALDVLQQDNPDLTMADLQALLWYPEKRLYDSAKLVEAEDAKGYVDDEAPDYANAAVGLARKFGVSEADIQSTIQEVDLELENQSIDRARVDESGERRPDGIQQDNETFRQGRRETEFGIDEGTGLPLNEDGTVTVYHHTNRRAAEGIRATNQLRSAGEPDVYVTTRDIADTGYGDTAVAIRIDPSRLSLDDEFPDGRRDFRLSVGKPRGSIRVEVGEFLQQDKSQESRGGFNPKTLTAFLNKEADISTFFHETAHFMLTVTEDLVLSGQATPEIQKDFEVLLDFWGVESVDAWGKLSLDEKRKYHEAFAYNYEIYLTEQKAAPSVALQEVFIRFGDYIRNLYKSIRDDLNELYRRENGRDLPVLTDEVRAVMDRMVASEEQITYSQRVYGMRPMFETQELSGMDDATWKEYTDAIQESQDAAIDTLTKDSIKQLKWLDNKGRLTTTLQDRETKAIRKKVKAEETAKAENETLYKLQKFLKKGEWNDNDNNPFRSAGTHKLDIESIRNLVPFYDMKSEIKTLGTGQWGMVSKDGLDVNMVAELFGFETAEGMINSLVALPPIKEVIKERTEQRMLDEFSGLTDPSQKESQVLRAIQNKARAKFLAIELRFLTKSMQPVRLHVAAARQVAKSVLSKTKINEIRPKKYAQNERRARKDLETAMKNGDDQGAIDAKRSELLNSQLAREATEILERYNKSLKKFKDIFKKSDEKIAKYRTVDYVNAAQEILAHFGLGPQLEEGTTFVDNLKKYDEHIWEEVNPIITDAKRLPGREVKDLTLQDFDTLDEVIESLMYQARRDKQFKVEGELREREEVSNELTTALNNMDPRASFAFGEGGQTKWWERMVSKLEGLKAVLRRVESWCDSKDGEVAMRAGDKSYAREIRGGGLLGGGVLVKKEGEVAGPFTRYIWRTLKDPINKWRTERPKWTGRYVDLLEQVDWSQIKIDAPELISKNGKSYVFGRERGMGKAELLGAMLHIGNKSNLTKLLDGRGWGEIREDGTLDSSRWEAFVDRMINEGHLTKKDFQFLQNVWDLNEELLPLTQRAHKDVFGYYFKTIEVTPIVNKFGTFRGGYVPAVADPEMSTRELSLDETIKTIKDEMKYAAPAVERGFTKPRTQKNRALSLNLGLQAAHLDNALRFAYIQPAITDLLRLFRDRKFSDALNRVDDKAMKGMLMPWLRNSASQKTTLGNNTIWDKGITRMTKSTSLNYMFASLKNGMQQVTGKLPARLKIEHKYLNDAFRRYTREPHKVAKEVAEMSPFMRDRQINQMFDVQDIMNDLIINPSKYEKFQKWVGKHAYFVQQAFQNYVDSVVWIAKYNQVLTNAPKTMTEAQIHAEAIQQADGAVRMTQDSLLPEDVAAYQINHPFYKAIFQFTSYFNAQANLNATQYKALIKELGWNSKQFSGQILFAFLFGFALPALVSEGIQELASGGLADEDEDGYIDEFFEFGYMSLFRYGTAFIPTGSTFLMVPFNMLDEKPYNDRITISPSISLINSTMQGTMRMLINLADPNKEVKGNEVRSVITLLGLIGNLPLYPLAKPIGLLHDLKDGRWVPRGPVDLIRGLVTGQAGEGRRR